MEIGLAVFLFLGELKGLYKIRLLRSLEKTHIHQWKRSTHFLYLLQQSSESARNKLSIIFIISGVKHMKGQNESAFPEEEEGVNEREEQWDH